MRVLERTSCRRVSDRTSCRRVSARPFIDVGNKQNKNIQVRKLLK